MSLVLRIAARNLLRHRGRSLVVGIILFLGAFVMTVGNGVLSGMARGLQTHIVEGFLGDVVVASRAQEDDNILFGVMGKSIAPLGDYARIKASLGRVEGIKAFVPVGKNPAMVLNEDGGNPTYAYLLGVDWEEYTKVFPRNFKAVEGEARPGKAPWLLLPAKARDEAFDMTAVWFSPQGVGVEDSHLTENARRVRSRLSVRQEMVLMGFSEDNSSSDVRLPIRGVVRYPALNGIWGHFSLVDIESYRRCLGYLAAGDRVELDSAHAALMGMENLDDLFGGAAPAAPVAARNESATDSVPAAVTGNVAAPPRLDDGAWNLVLVRLQPGVTPQAGVEAIEAAFARDKVAARAIVWNKAAGPIGGMALIIKGALFVFVGLLFVVAAIIVMNTLSMAALERSGEIGMMRAIGAGRGFIRAMFAGETLILALAFGGLGILAGALTVQVVAGLHLSTDNDFLQMAYGGETFQPFLTLSDYLLALLQLAGSSFVALLYPMSLAARTSPLEAIARD